MAIYKVDGCVPQVGAAAFVADNATLARGCDPGRGEQRLVRRGAAGRLPGASPLVRAATCRTTPCCTPARGWM